VIELCGGIAPRADAAPWTLDDAIAALDQLQMVAETTDRELHFPDRGLEELKAPGIAAEVAKRLGNKALAPRVRELLIDVALAVSAEESLPVAQAMFQDDAEDGRLRLSALTLFARFATDDQLLS